MQDTQTLIDRLPDGIRQNAYVVGKWVWVEFASKPTKEILDFLHAEDFHWNRERKVWQNSCGHYSRNASYDPRGKYGIRKIGITETIATAI